MKKTVFFLWCIGCIFSLSHCDKIGILDDEISLIETWDYSKIAFIAQTTDTEWNLYTMMCLGRVGDLLDVT